MASSVFKQTPVEVPFDVESSSSAEVPVLSCRSSPPLSGVDAVMVPSDLESSSSAEVPVSSCRSSSPLLGVNAETFAGSSSINSSGTAFVRAQPLTPLAVSGPTSAVGDRGVSLASVAPAGPDSQKRRKLKRRKPVPPLRGADSGTGAGPSSLQPSGTALDSAQPSTPLAVSGPTSVEEDKGDSLTSGMLGALFCTPATIKRVHDTQHGTVPSRFCVHCIAEARAEENARALSCQRLTVNTYCFRRTRESLSGLLIEAFQRSRLRASAAGVSCPQPLDRGHLDLLSYDELHKLFLSMRTSLDNG